MARQRSCRSSVRTWARSEKGFDRGPIAAAIDIWMVNIYILSVIRLEVSTMVKAAALREVRMRADKDGCLSGPAFSGALNAVWKESRERPETQITLLLLDLDNLHQLNTAHGREAGDRAVNAAVTELSRTAKRESWTLGRIGGDEFALLAPGLTVESAFLRADTLRRDIDAAFAKALARGQRCAVSIGVANIPRDAKSPEDLLRKADLALYAAKEQGGDTVGLTPADDMVLKSSYYSAAQLARLKGLAERWTALARGPRQLQVMGPQISRVVRVFRGRDELGPRRRSLSRGAVHRDPSRGWDLALAVGLEWIHIECGRRLSARARRPDRDHGLVLSRRVRVDHTAPRHAARPGARGSGSLCQRGDGDRSRLRRWPSGALA